MPTCKTIVLSPKLAVPGAQTASATIAVMCAACVLNTASSHCWLSTVVLPRIYDLPLVNLLAWVSGGVLEEDDERIDDMIDE